MNEQEPQSGAIQEPERKPDGTFAPGSSGNSSGRPRLLAGIIRQALKDIPVGQEISVMQMLVKVLVYKGVNDKDIAAIRELFDRGYGKAVQVMSLDMEEEIKQIEVKIVRNEATPKDRNQ